MNARLAAVFLALTWPLIGGCSNPNDTFSGRWVSTRQGPTGQAVGYDGVIKGVPELALGHYGPELAGVVYFGVPGGSRFQSPCPCAYIDHLRTDREEGILEFETRCEDVSVAYWRLTRRRDPLDGELYLEGTVGRADGEGVAEQVAFQLRAEEVVDADKQCPP